MHTVPLNSKHDTIQLAVEIAGKCNFVTNRHKTFYWLKQYRDTEREIGLRSKFKSITTLNIDEFEEEQGVELWIYNDERILRRPKVVSDKRVFLLNRTDDLSTCALITSFITVVRKKKCFSMTFCQAIARELKVDYKVIEEQFFYGVNTVVLDSDYKVYDLFEIGLNIERYTEKKSFTFDIIFRTNHERAINILFKTSNMIDRDTLVLVTETIGMPCDVSANCMYKCQSHDARHKINCSAETQMVHVHKQFHRQVPISTVLIK